MRSPAQKYKNGRLSAGCSHNNKYGGLTEWLRSSPGKRVRCNSPVGSSPMSSARIQRPVSGLFFIEIYWNFMGKKWLFLMVRHPGNHEFPFFKIKQQAGNCFTRYLQRREKQFPGKQFLYLLRNHNECCPWILKHLQHWTSHMTLKKSNLGIHDASKHLNREINSQLEQDNFRSGNSRMKSAWRNNSSHRFARLLPGSDIPLFLFQLPPLDHDLFFRNLCLHI